MLGQALVATWIRKLKFDILQNVQRRNATKLLLSKEDNKPTLQGWLTKVKNGHAKKCWCVLIGKMFLYFKNPGDAVSMHKIRYSINKWWKGNLKWMYTHKIWFCNWPNITVEWVLASHLHISLATWTYTHDIVITHKQFHYFSKVYFKKTTMKNWYFS